jgi:hypothetical protein
MSLVNLQRAMAELFTDAQLRAIYTSDRSSFERRHALDEKESAQLTALSASAIASYASTLVCKRRSEALRLLPLTRAELKVDFATAFDRWAERTQLPAGPTRYAADARAFCKHLRASRSTFSRAIRRAAATDVSRLRPSPLARLLGRG